MVLLGLGSGLTVVGLVPCLGILNWAAFPLDMAMCIVGILGLRWLPRLSWLLRLLRLTRCWLLRLPRLLGLLGRRRLLRLPRLLGLLRLCRCWLLRFPRLLGLSRRLLRLLRLTETTLTCRRLMCWRLTETALTCRRLLRLLRLTEAALAWLAGLDRRSGGHAKRLFGIVGHGVS